MSPTAPIRRVPHTTTAPSQAVLLEFVRRSAADPNVVGLLDLDPAERTWVRLEGPAGSEAWLIGWPPGTGTGWHDHGGSQGAFTTAAGELIEESVTVSLPTKGWVALELAEGVDRVRHLPVGQGRAFGRRHVHQVVNPSPARHAISVHAYHPPLPMMRRYSRIGAVLRLEQVERQEDW